MAKPKPTKGVPALRLRRRGPSATWYIRFKGKLIPTGCREDDKDGADAVLASFIKSQSQSSTDLRSVFPVKISVILAHEASRRKEKVAEGKLKSANQTQMNPIYLFWGQMSVSEFSAKSITEYKTNRTTANGPFAGMKRVSKRSAHAELEVLRTAINVFAAKNGLIGRVSLPWMQFVTKRRAIVSRSDLARLLWATLGYEWNEKAQKFHKSADHNTFLRKKYHRRRYARLILICAYSATSPECAIDLKWDGKPVGDQSYVDLKEHRVQMYRLGSHSALGKLAGVPLILNWRLTAHLRRWHRLKVGDDNAYILQGIYADRSRAVGVNSVAFARIRSDAGLRSRILLSDIAYSAGVHLARNPKVNLRSSAMMRGMKASRFLEVYNVFRPKYQAGAVAALMRKPDTIR